MHFNLCEWGRHDPKVWTWGDSVAQSWRCGGDHGPTWRSTSDIIHGRSQIPPAQGGAPFGWNDMDMLELGNLGQAAAKGDMTPTEAHTEFSMWAVFASPLIVTTPLLNCSRTDQIRGNYTPGRCRPSITPLQKQILLNQEVSGLPMLQVVQIDNSDSFDSRCPGGGATTR